LPQPRKSIARDIDEQKQYRVIRLIANFDCFDDVRSTDLLPEETAESKTFDTIQWVSVLPVGLSGLPAEGTGTGKAVRCVLQPINSSYASENISRLKMGRSQTVPSNRLVSPRARELPAHRPESFLPAWPDDRLPGTVAPGCHRAASPQKIGDRPLVLDDRQAQRRIADVVLNIDVSATIQEQHSH
jgi:hypothetical protein